NIPRYRNSELRYFSAIPVLEEGRSYVVTNVDRGAVDAAAAGTRMRDQGEMNLVRSFCVRTNGADAYGKTMWSWPSLLRSSLAEMDRALPGLGASPIRKVTVTKGNSSPGGAWHKPST